MKKIILISLILGTALAQLQGERKRIANLRRRQELINLSEQELNNGGFLPSGSSRIPERFRGLEPSFESFTGGRRFRNASPARRRSYLQSLSAKLLRTNRKGSRKGRRTYTSAIKRPRFTPDLQDILPRRTPSYSPTARGVNPSPRIPSTVLGFGNFLPTNLNDFIERTNPVNDRSYVTPRKPSLIAEPLPLPLPMGPNHISTKDPVPSLKVKPDYITPKEIVDPLPLPTEPGYVEPKVPAGPVPLPPKPDYIAQKEPVPLSNEPGYVAPNELADSLPLSPKSDYVVPKKQVDPIMPSPKADYVAPKELIDPIMPSPKADYVAPKELIDPIMPLTKADYVEPKDAVDHLPLPTDPGYVAPKKIVDPILPSPKADYVAPKELIDPIMPSPKADYVAPKELIDPIMPSPKADYVKPKELIDPIIPLPKEDYVAPKNVVDLLPLPHNSGYVEPKEIVDPILTSPNSDYVAPKNAIDSVPVTIKSDYVAPKGPIDPISHGPDSLPLLPKTADYVPTGDLDIQNTPDLVAPLPSLPKLPFEPLDPLNIPQLPIPADNSNFEQSLPNLSGPLGPIIEPIHGLPMDPLGQFELPTLPGKDANYAGSNKQGPLDGAPLQIPVFPGEPIVAKDPNYVEPSVPGADTPFGALPLGPFDPINTGVPSNDPNYVDPLSMTPIDPLGPLTPLAPIDVLDNTDVLSPNKPGYVPPIEPLGVDPTGELFADPFSSSFNSPFTADAFMEPLVPTGGIVGKPLTSSKTSSKQFALDKGLPSPAQGLVSGDQAIVDPPFTPTEPEYVEPPVQVSAGKKDVSKPVLPKETIPSVLPSNVMGLLDLPQDPFGEPLGVLPPGSLPPFDVGSMPFPDLPALPGSPDAGLGAGVNDPSLPPEGYAPEPDLPESQLFDGTLPPMPDLPPTAGDVVMPDQLSMAEINDAARREYAKLDNAFDQRWDNPNVRNSDLYVKARPVDAKDVRPAKISTLFDFLPGGFGSDILTNSVDRVSDRTRGLIEAARRKKQGYTSKYDALRSYEG
ncbi:calphotin-like [Argopecten irradians]|uniref:calphotin-like n=1 Tax=Argopecten irradians TaxID=31199 RepID=UPI00370F7E94